MFSGIVESQSRIVKILPLEQALKVVIERPFTFDDVKVGDSISVDGTCLTVETVTPEEIEFVVGPETLRLTTFKDLSDDSSEASRSKFSSRPLNLERSLKLGDRVHGHIVMGHVDETAKVQEITKAGSAIRLAVQIPSNLRAFVWQKGSLAVNGVSLTVNSVSESFVDLCLIPETIRRTNLAHLHAGDLVNIEIDFMARGIVNSRELTFE